MDLWWTPGRSNGQMHEYIGKNGLTLLLVPRKGMSVTTANITYHVGSRNEGLGLKGATHYLEHGMFKGSKNFHGKNGMWKLEEMGMYMNATTYTDRTNYFEVTETKHLNEAIVREADRMLQPLLTQELLDSEMTVVRNEFERGNNNDFEIAHKRMTATAFLAHPYHHSTIGWKSDIENVTAESLQEFHKTYYIPSNATYTFVGNFDPENVKRMVYEAFKDIPRGADIPKMYTKEPPQMGQRRVMIQKPTQTSLMGIGFKSVHGLHRDSIVNQVLARYLTDGPQAVVEPLRKGNNIHDVMASCERMKDPYLFNVWVTTNFASKCSLQEAEKSIMYELTHIKEPSIKHLQTIKQKLKFEWKESMQSTRGMASEINESVARGNAFDVYEKFDILDSVTPQDVARAAKVFDARQSTVVYVLPGKSAPEYYDGKNYAMPSMKSSPQTLVNPQSDVLSFKKASTVQSTHSHTQFDIEKNHLRLSMMSESNFTAKEYVSRLVLAEMMSKGVYFNNGAYDASQVEEFYDKNGITRNFSVSDYGIRVHFVLPKTKASGLSLLKKEIMSPLLNESDFEYIKHRLSSELRGTSSNVNAMAKILLNQQLFDKGLHYRHSVSDLIGHLQTLSYNDIRDQHVKMLNGKSVMTTLGPQDIGFDIASKGLIRQEPKRKEGKDVKMNIPGKTSCTVLMGTHVNASLATQIAVGCLGNGFSGRLMKHVRDKLGLTYGIEAYVNPKHQTMHISSTFNPSLLEKGLKETRKIISEWREGVTQDEIDIQKTIMKGIRKVRFDNSSNIINMIHMEKIKGNDMAFIDSYDERVDKVSFEDVQQAIKDINTKLHTVIVGTLQ